jgi:ATP-dependent Clp protease ATP-binding subunit ClpC
LFLGPSGVGKTELARALAECMFGSETQLIRIDMSECQEAHAAARLIGAPPGYIGYEEGGQLTEAVRRKPYAVVLLDEIEKAHPALLHLLLQLLDDGVLTDGQGRRVDFRNTIIIMTSNVGGESLQQRGGLGFTADQTSAAAAQRAQIDDALQRAFRPEFLNRIDARLIFQPLTPAELREISALLLQPLRQQLSARGITLDVRDDAYDLLAQTGDSSRWGARPLRRTITALIEDPLTDGILAGRFAVDDVVTVDTAPLAEGRPLLRFSLGRTSASAI